MSNRAALLFALCILMFVPPVSPAAISLSGDDARTTITYETGTVATCADRAGAILLSGNDTGWFLPLFAASVVTCPATSAALLLSGADTAGTVPLQAAAIPTCPSVSSGILLSGDDARMTLTIQQPCVNRPGKIPGAAGDPTDPDCDGIYEDLNGNGRLDFADVVLYFSQMQWIAENEPFCGFDLNGNLRIDFADIVALFNEI